MRIKRCQSKRGCLFSTLRQAWIRLLSQQIVPRGHRSTGPRSQTCPSAVQRSSDALSTSSSTAPWSPAHSAAHWGQGPSSPLTWQLSSSSLYNQTFPLRAAESVPFHTRFPGVIRFYWHVLTFKASVWKDIWACKCRSSGKSLALGPLGSFIKTQMWLLL